MPWILRHFDQVSAEAAAYFEREFSMNTIEMVHEVRQSMASVGVMEVHNFIYI